MSSDVKDFTALCFPHSREPCFADKPVTLVTAQMHVKWSAFDFNTSEVAANHMHSLEWLNQGFPLCCFEMVQINDSLSLSSSPVM